LGINNDDYEASTVIYGKDSLDCVTKVLDLCANAEAKLNGGTWNGCNVICVCERNYGSQIYSKQYGVSDDNFQDDEGQEDGFEEHPFHKGSVFFWSKCLQRGQFISKISFQQQYSDVSSSVNWVKNHYYSHNLNVMYYDDCVFPIAHISSLTKDEVKEMVKKYYKDGTKDSRLNGLIGDMVLLYGKDHPNTIVYNGATYEIMHSGTEGEKGPQDLNATAGGDYIWLYVSHDVYRFEKILDGEETVVWECPRAVTIDYHLIGRGAWNSAVFVPGVRLKSGTEAELLYPDGGDCAKGANGAWSTYFFIRAGYVDFYHFNNGNF